MLPETMEGREEEEATGGSFTPFGSEVEDFRSETEVRRAGGLRDDDAGGGSREGRGVAFDVSGPALDAAFLPSSSFSSSDKSFFFGGAIEGGAGLGGMARCGLLRR